MKTSVLTNKVYRSYLEQGVDPAAASTLTLADAINRLATKIDNGIPDGVSRGIREALLHSEEFSGWSDPAEVKTHSR